MSLKGTVILWTDLVYGYQPSSYVVLDDYGTRALCIEASPYAELDRAVGDILKFEWTMKEWEDYGWEIIPPVECRKMGS